MPNMVKIGLRAWAGPIPSLSRSPLCFFVFFTLCTGHNAGPIATLNGSYDVVSDKEVPFGGLNDKKIMFRGKNPKNVNFGGRNRRFKPNLQNIQMAISLKVIMRLE